jgi:integrase
MNTTKNSKPGSVYPFLDARTPMKNSNMLPVKLSINIKGKVFRVGLKLHATPEVFNKAISSKGSITNEAKKLKAEIDTYIDKANKILDMFPIADQKMFTKLFKSEVGLNVRGKNNMELLFQNKIEELVEEDRAGTACFYEVALKVFKRFKNEFYLEDITVSWLKAYRAWWLNQGYSNATAGMHLRALRHIYNRAIKDNLVSQSHYPFKDYVIGSSSKSKDVLYPEQMKMLWEYEPKTKEQARSKDFFIFLYLQNGLNIKDGLSLKGSQIKGEMISFVRAKTARTTSETKEIMMYLHPESIKIIKKRGNIDTKDYLFPYFRGTKSDIERKAIKDQFARKLNVGLHAIGKELGLPMPLNLNLARHSFATRLLIDGTPTGHISDALGHSSGAITAHYLKTLPDEKYKRIGESLLEFK